MPESNQISDVFECKFFFFGFFEKKEKAQLY